MRAHEHAELIAVMYGYGLQHPSFHCVAAISLCGCHVTACRYDSARTHDKFLEYIVNKVESDKSFARVEDLDELVKKYMSAAKADKDKVVAEITKKVESLKDDAKENGELYVKLIAKGIEKVSEGLPELLPGPSSSVRKYFELWTIYKTITIAVTAIGCTVL